MDAFYASVEQLDFPDLSGKPIAVGGGGIRGVVAAASYEARKFGVRSAISGALAKELCPDLIFVKPRFSRYQEISKEIRKIFFEYSDLVEPLSLDEAFIDVTENKKGLSSASSIARKIREEIKEKTGLNASAGISINKFLAKIASDINKPNGQKTIPPEEVDAFLEELPIEKFFGIGKVTAKKMYSLGIFTGKDLKNKSLDFLEKHFKNSGKHYYLIVRGIQNSAVKPNRIRKSIAVEHTYSENLTSEIFMMEKLEKIAKELIRRIEKSKTKGKTITLKIKYSDFSVQTRSKTLDHFIATEEEILELTKMLLYQNEILNSVRLLGISLSNLNTEKKEPPKNRQLRFDF